MTTSSHPAPDGRNKSVLLDEKQAAEHLTLSPGTLQVWRSTGRYALPFIKVGRNVRYRLDDLNAWLAARARESGATA